MEHFLNTVLEYINVNNLVGGNGILVAFSGGADSAALLDALCVLRDSGRLNCKISAGHINHNLRGDESDGDEQFCQDFAARVGAQYLSQSIDIEGFAAENSLSIESAARQIRRERLAGMAYQLECSMIATAHHKGDNAETIIHRLSRGTGIKGLAGIWPLRRFDSDFGSVNYIRPLLCVNRVQIEDYCRDRGIKWRTDSTNRQLIYTRNVIRHTILPQLQADCKQDIAELLCRLTDTSRRLYAKIEQLTAQLWYETVSMAEDDVVVMAADAFNSAAAVVRQELLRLAYNRVGGSESKITQQHYEDMLAFVAGTDSAKLQLPCEIYCFRGYGRIILQKISEQGMVFTNINGCGSYKFKDSQITVDKQPFVAAAFKGFLKNKSPLEEWFDADKLKLPILVRSRETGDRFSPIGLRTPMKIGKFLIGAKIDHQRRCEMMIFEDAAKNIIWVAPHRASNITKITDATTQVYKITIAAKPSGLPY